MQYLHRRTGTLLNCSLQSLKDLGQDLLGLQAQKQLLLQIESAVVVCGC